MKFIVNGAKGRMGAQIVALLKKEDCPHELLAGVDINATEGDGFFSSLSDVTQKADCIIDFSHHSATKQICDYATKNAVPVLFATTGQTPEELEMNLVDMSKKYNMELDKLKELISEPELDSIKKEMVFTKTIEMLTNKAIVE